MTAGRLPAEQDNESGLDLVLARAATDRAFRERLLRDPHGAIAEALHVELGPSFRIKFVEKDPHVTMMVVLPDLIGDHQ